MPERTQRLINITAIAITATLLTVIAGCTKSGPKTFPVKGQLVSPDGSAATFAGHTVEVALDSDPQVRAAGQIQSDGSFVLETLRAGVVLPGAVEGTYKARIVLTDDDLARRNQAAKSLHPRFLGFEKSGLSLRVPADEVASLKVTRR